MWHRDSVSGNQLSRPNVVASWTDDELESPVDAEELAQFLGLMNDGDTVVPQQAMLDGLLLAATQAVIDYTQREILPRSWNYRADRYPEREAAYSGLAPMASLRSWWVDLPACPVISVESANADEWEADPRTGRVFLKETIGDPVEIEYTAGYATPPAWALQAIKQVAAYLYEHRGECDAGDAVQQSGALSLLRAHRRIVGGL